MKLNLYSEIVFEPKDYFDFLKEEILKQSYISFKPNLDTSHGILIDKILPKIGIYLIYKTINGNNQLLYVGCSDHSIYKRLCRYVSAVRGTQRHDENHAGGEKHREILGEDLDDMYVKFIYFDFSSLVGVKMQDLESVLIDKLEPIFNGENYWKYKFEKKLEIVKNFT